jgi:hypothetical protein
LKKETKPLENHNKKSSEETENKHLGLYTDEEWTTPVFEGGPTRQEIEEWKKKYMAVYFTPFENEKFIWRPLKRPEYRQLIEQKEMGIMDREEAIMQAVILFPRDFDIKEYIAKGGRAGVPSLIADMVMDKSGFTAQSAPIEL